MYLSFVQFATVDICFGGMITLPEGAKSAIMFLKLLVVEQIRFSIPLFSRHTAFPREGTASTQSWV